MHTFCVTKIHNITIYIYCNNSIIISSIFLFQSNQRSGSYHMEKYGLCQALARIESNAFTVGQLVTDRHLSIGKMMREDYPEVDHLFDIWHVAKGNIPSGRGGGRLCCFMFISKMYRTITVLKY